MYEDLPQRHVWDVLAKLLYGDTPAGRSIVGPKENIKSFKRKDFMRYRNAHYVAEKTLIVVAGDIDDKEVKKEVEKAFKNISTGKFIKKPVVKNTQKAPAMLVEKKKTDQLHMVLAFKGFDAHDKRIPALSVLSGVLGGGMSSRLFQRLREEMGVCYYIRSANDEYTDHGYFAVSTGIDPKRLDEVIKVILLECERMTTEIVPEDELQKTKDYLSGNLYLGLETTDSLAEFYGIQEIVKGKTENPVEWERELRSVTAEEVQKVAREIFKNERMNLAIVGQVKNEKSIKKLLTF
jgi:predicted Zn-dependent peptidase